MDGTQTATSSIYISIRKDLLHINKVQEPTGFLVASFPRKRHTVVKPSTVRGHEVKKVVSQHPRGALCLCPTFVPKTGRCTNHKETTEAVLKCHDIRKDALKHGEAGDRGTLSPYVLPQKPRSGVRGPTGGPVPLTSLISIYVLECRRWAHRGAGAPWTRATIVVCRTSPPSPRGCGGTTFPIIRTFSPSPFTPKKPFLQLWPSEKQKKTPGGGTSWTPEFRTQGPPQNPKNQKTPKKPKTPPKPRGD